MTGQGAAAYIIFPAPDGNRYGFFCGMTGALACITRPFRGSPQSEELQTAWEDEGRQHFNLCHRCGRWVIDAAFNPDVLECVACAPFEDEPVFCKFCGARVRQEGRYCRVCGKPLRYEGGAAP